VVGSIREAGCEVPIGVEPDGDAFDPRGDLACEARRRRRLTLALGRAPACGPGLLRELAADGLVRPPCQVRAIRRAIREPGLARLDDLRDVVPKQLVVLAVSELSIPDPGLEVLAGLGRVDLRVGQRATQLPAVHPIPDDDAVPVEVEVGRLDLLDGTGQRDADLQLPQVPAMDGAAGQLDRPDGREDEILAEARRQTPKLPEAVARDTVVVGAATEADEDAARRLKGGIERRGCGGHAPGRDVRLRDPARRRR
jgi:hypothetical protein